MRLGISKIDEYATAFGLGEKTGVEIAESQVFLHLPKTEKTTAEYGTQVTHFKPLSVRVITFSLLSSLQTTAQQLQTAEQDMSFTL